MHCEQAVWLDSYFPAGHALHVVDPDAAFTIDPPPQDVHTISLVLYFPAPHGVHVVDPDAAFTTNTPRQDEHETMVPAVEYVPGPHGLFVVAPLDDGHWDPSGQGEQFSLIATPAAS